MNNRHKWRAAVAERLEGTEPQMALAFIREFVASLPGTSEKPCYSTPAFYVNNKLISRLREDCRTLVVNSTERDKWMAKDPETYFITDHYLNYDSLLVNLDTVSPEELKGLILTAWRNRAPAKLIKEYDAR